MVSALTAISLVIFLYLLNTFSNGLPADSLQINKENSSRRRRPRYAIADSKWDTSNLTYHIMKYSKKLSKDFVDTEIRYAFDAWSSVANLTFAENKTGKADININFVEGKHDFHHTAFDGPGGTLAHANYPKFGGFICFDDSEDWIVAGFGEVDFLKTAVHEIGHSLGLNHSKLLNTAMYPHPNGIGHNLLHKDDIEGIQSIYGKNPDWISPEDLKKRVFDMDYLMELLDNHEVGKANRLVEEMDKGYNSDLYYLMKLLDNHEIDKANRFIEAMDEAKDYNSVFDVKYLMKLLDNNEIDKANRLIEFMD